MSVRSGVRSFDEGERPSPSAHSQICTSVVARVSSWVKMSEMVPLICDAHASTSEGKSTMDMFVMPRGVAARMLSSSERLVRAFRHCPSCFC
ncbi:hypothetical protein D3C80_1896300 [compost metagenome]